LVYINATYLYRTCTIGDKIYCEKRAHTEQEDKIVVNLNCIGFTIGSNNTLKHSKP